MPFTPLHMGPGMLLKSVLQDRFSLVVFGWTQIVMDIQPLLVMITGKGHMHGFTHSYIGATLVSVVAALSGKYISQRVLNYSGYPELKTLNVSWKVAFISAFVGGYSHVFLDSIMHVDLQPYFPFSEENTLQGILSISVLHQVCIYTGIVGLVIYFSRLQNRKLFKRKK